MKPQTLSRPHWNPFQLKSFFCCSIWSEIPHCIYLSIYLSIIYLSIHPSIHRIHPSIHLSNLSICDGYRTQGLVHARQVLYHWAASPALMLHLDVSLVTSDLWQFLGLTFRTLKLLKSAGQVFCRLSLSLGLPDVFPWLHWGYGFGEKNHTETTGPSESIVSGDMWHWHVLLLVMFILMSSFRFLQCNVTIIFLLKLVKVEEQLLWG
jgi:hypothetical protein